MKGDYKKIVVISAMAVVVLMIGFLVSFLLLTPEWLKGRLERKAAAAGAQLEIKSIEFDPFTARATLSKVKYVRKKAESDLEMTVDIATVKLNPFLLPFRVIHISNLELDHPYVEIYVRRPAQVKSGGTMEKLKRFAGKTVDNIQKTSKIRNARWTVDRLRVTEGHVRYKFVRGTQNPFWMSMLHIDYSAGNIALDTLDNIFSGADLEARVDIDDWAIMNKKGSVTPSTFSLTSVNLHYIDRLFDQTDALVLTGGYMDLEASCDHPNKKIHFIGRMRDLKVDINKDTVGREFLFIPMDRLVKYIQSKKGNLAINFTMDGDKFEASPDLDFLVKEFWNGFLAAIAKELQVKTVHKFSRNL